MENRRERRGGFFSGIRKEVAGVMAGLAIGGAASEAGAQQRRVEDKSEDAFEELGLEKGDATEEVSEVQVISGRDDFQTRVVGVVGAEGAKGVLASLDKELKRSDLSLDNKLEVVALFSDQFREWLSNRRNISKKDRGAVSTEKVARGKSAVVDSAKDIFTELDESAFGLGSFFDDSVSYEDVIKSLDILIVKGTAVEKNGVKFVKDNDGKLYFGLESKKLEPVTPASREKMVKAYKAVGDKLKSEGVTLD